MDSTRRKGKRIITMSSVILKAYFEQQQGIITKASTEAVAYVDALQTKGATEPVDVDPSAITLSLPEWYDARLFKR